MMESWTTYICHASDLACFGYGPILKPLLADLELHSGGFSVTVNDGKEYILRAPLDHITADNLAANQIMGLNGSFSKEDLLAVDCRFCYTDAKKYPYMVYADSTILRSGTNHLIDFMCVEADSSFSKRTGVREISAVADLSYHSLLVSTVSYIIAVVLNFNSVKLTHDLWLIV